jgi:hypothetical protein
MALGIPNKQLLYLRLAERCGNLLLPPSAWNKWGIRRYEKHHAPSESLILLPALAN